MTKPEDTKDTKAGGSKLSLRALSLLISALRRDVDNLKKAVARPGARTLDDLLDTEVLYDHCTDLPKHGQALRWDTTRESKYNGLAVFADEPDMPYATYNTGLVDAGDTIDLYDYGDAPPPGMYFAAVTAQATPPADCCGWLISASVNGSGGTAVIANEASQVGFGQGIWTGSTGDSGTYGWQAPAPPYPLMNVGAVALVGIEAGGSLTASATVLAYVLDDPGSSSSDFGAKTCSTVTAVEVSIAVTLRRLSPWLP